MTQPTYTLEQLKALAFDALRTRDAWNERLSGLQKLIREEEAKEPAETPKEKGGKQK